MPTTLEYLEKAYNDRKQAMDLAWQDTQRLGQEQITNAETQASGLAQEVYVNKKQQERVLPNVMAHAGLAGTGYTETTANAIGTAYQNAWNDIQTNKGNAIQGINSNLMTAKSQYDAGLLGLSADYADQQNALAQQQAEAQARASSSSRRSSSSGSSASGSADINDILAQLTTGQPSDAIGAGGSDWAPFTSWVNTQLDDLVKQGYITQKQADGLWNQVIAYWESKKYARTGYQVPNRQTTPTTPVPSSNTTQANRPNTGMSNPNARVGGQRELMYDYDSIVGLR